MSSGFFFKTPLTPRPGNLSNVPGTGSRVRFARGSYGRRIHDQGRWVFVVGDNEERGMELTLSNTCNGPSRYARHHSAYSPVLFPLRQDGLYATIGRCPCVPLPRTVNQAPKRVQSHRDGNRDVESPPPSRNLRSHRRPPTRRRRHA